MTQHSWKSSDFTEIKKISRRTWWASTYSIKSPSAATTASIRDGYHLNAFATVSGSGPQFCCEALPWPITQRRPTQNSPNVCSQVSWEERPPCHTPPGRDLKDLSGSLRMISSKLAARTFLLRLLLLLCTFHFVINVKVDPPKAKLLSNFVMNALFYVFSSQSFSWYARRKAQRVSRLLDLPVDLFLPQCFYLFLFTIRQIAEMVLRKIIFKKSDFLMHQWSFEIFPEISLPPCIY